MREAVVIKIAVLTDDGTTVSQRFGRARDHAVVTVEEGRESGRELLERTDTMLPVAEYDARQGLTGEIDCHGTGTAAAASHLRMVQPIQDCQVLLARGMSWSARELAGSAGIPAGPSCGFVVCPRLWPSPAGGGQAATRPAGLNGPVHAARAQGSPSASLPSALLERPEQIPGFLLDHAFRVIQLVCLPSWADQPPRVRSGADC